MRNLFLLFIMIICSCTDDHQKINIDGVWENFKSENDNKYEVIEFNLNNPDSNLDSIKNKKFLHFIDENKLVEYRAGLGFSGNYILTRKHLIIDNTLKLKVIRYKNDTLILGYSDTDKIDFYVKVNKDLSDIKIID